MLQTLNPYTSTAKTAEIMARYRPIAPRPQAQQTSNGGDGDGSGSGSGSMSPTIRQSPYLRNVWPHLQSRPTRTRKRGRTSLGPPPPPPTFKRPRTLLQGLSPPFHITTTTPTTASPAGNHLPIQGFAPLPTTTTTLVTLPLLPCSPITMQPNNVIDLNKVADVPEEKDLLAQLQKKPTTSTDVISPRPIRLIPSTVTIRAIKDDTCPVQMVSKKKAEEEVERELESQVLPAFVSDSNNQVRLVNSAYKEMVGQPECPWLESMITVGVACKSICGEVLLNFTDSDQDLSGSGGFSCWARIEWGINGNNNNNNNKNKKKLVNAFGEAMRLECESKDYKFAWRFHTREASEAASNV